MATPHHPVPLAVDRTDSGLNTAYSDRGDSATFEITVTNTGNTRLSEVLVTDSNFGGVGNLDCKNDFSSTSSELLPASHPDETAFVCQAITVLTVAHVDAGGIGGTSKVHQVLHHT